MTLTWTPTQEPARGITTHMKKPTHLSSLSPSLCLLWYVHLCFVFQHQGVTSSIHLSICLLLSTHIHTCMHPADHSPIYAYIDLHCTPRTELGMQCLTLNKTVLIPGPFKAQGLMRKTNGQEYREESHDVGGGPNSAFKLVAYGMNSLHRYILFLAFRDFVCV